MATTTDALSKYNSLTDSKKQKLMQVAQTRLRSWALTQDQYNKFLQTTGQNVEFKPVTATAEDTSKKTPVPWNEPIKTDNIWTSEKTTKFDYKPTQDTFDQYAAATTDLEEKQAKISERAGKEKAALIKAWNEEYRKTLDQTAKDKIASNDLARQQIEVQKLDKQRIAKDMEKAAWLEANIQAAQWGWKLSVAQLSWLNTDITNKFLENINKAKSDELAFRDTMNTKFNDLWIDSAEVSRVIWEFKKKLTDDEIEPLLTAILDSSTNRRDAFATISNAYWEIQKMKMSNEQNRENLMKSATEIADVLKWKSISEQKQYLENQLMWAFNDKAKVDQLLSWYTPDKLNSLLSISYWKTKARDTERALKTQLLANKDADTVATVKKEINQVAKPTVQKVEEVKDVASFKAAWATPEILASLVNKKYNNNAQVVWDIVIWMKDWVLTKWTIDTAKNPIAWPATTADIIKLNAGKNPPTIWNYSGYDAAPNKKQEVIKRIKDANALWKSNAEQEVVKLFREWLLYKK